MGTLKCVCVSLERKKSARNIHQGTVVPGGISGDCRCGKAGKHISILPYETVKAFFDEKGEPIRYGRFGENLVVEGLDWASLKEGDKFRCADVILEVTKIGASWPGMETFEGDTVCTPMEDYFVFCKVLHVGILTEEEPFLSC